MDSKSCVFVSILHNILRIAITVIHLRYQSKAWKARGEKYGCNKGIAVFLKSYLLSHPHTPSISSWNNEWISIHVTDLNCTIFPSHSYMWSENIIFRMVIGEKDPTFSFELESTPKDPNLDHIIQISNSLGFMLATTSLLKCFIKK